MENGVYEGRCGSCALFRKAVDMCLENRNGDHWLYIIKMRSIEPNTDGIRMHATDIERAGVRCMYCNKEMVTADTPACESYGILQDMKCYI